jgi:hypothetical protein
MVNAVGNFIVDPGLARVDLEAPAPTLLQMHFQVLRPVTHTAVKRFIAMFEALRSAAKDCGFESITAANPSLTDERWPHFIKIFGFPPPMAISVMSLKEQN